MKFKIIFFFCFIFHIIDGQSYRSFHHLDWNTERSTAKHSFSRLPEFKDAIYSSAKPSGPIFKTVLPLTGPGQLNVHMNVIKEHSVSEDYAAHQTGIIAETYVIQSQILNDRNTYSASIEITAIKRIPGSNQLQCLDVFEIIPEFIPAPSPSPLPDFTRVSAAV